MASRPLSRGLVLVYIHFIASENKCLCSIAYTGPRCNDPRPLPAHMHSLFDGSLILNRQQLKQLPKANGYKITYKCNPKASGGTHSFILPVTEEMLFAAPLQDPFKGSLYETCAVVGNSGILNRYQFGSKIDMHDLVIRFNLAPTIGYESTTGTKTSFRLVNSQHAGHHEGDEAVIQQMQSDVGIQLYLKVRAESPEKRLFAFDPEFSTYVSSNINTLPTGGYFAIWLAIQKCVNINVYGFHFGQGFGVDHHYFNDELPKQGQNAIHDYNAEFEMIKELARADIVHFPIPCAAGCENETGIPDKVASGGVCMCNNPLPVAQSGYCRAHGIFTCFIKCPGGSEQCPGGLHLPLMSDISMHSEPIDGDGDCPEELERRHRRISRKGKVVWVGCAAA